ncbi:MAG: aminodeoxychorismate/anthranilate synthase component II [Candidatus Rokubacteria bacterium]|nr:aminodeoxychorismate/anthranilate synthase component II [Candidatus Rokubacteria bacterium]MBI3825527.1 aminodeoxychorismate/anthranilate synthase component II [Candidatus Rokubacteria bacterium]
MILVIDNYDSFTYNLVQYLGELGATMDVVRNDALDVDTIAARRPERIVISPGPGTPQQAGVSIDVIRRLGATTPILGVCLGHQAIGAAYGATVDRAPRQMHGKTSEIHHDGRGVYAGVGNPFVATRYHSLVVLRDTVPADLEITAWTDQGEIMGLRHRRHPVEGVQFHPESILTTEGKRLLANFLTSGAGEACLSNLPPGAAPAPPGLDPHRHG